ncbi:MAG: precorrin-3B C(17)-methyltransferase [Nitrospinota bacterium]
MGGGRSGRGAGALFVVGIGPGAPEHLTGRARELIGSCQTAIGYHTYLELIAEFLAGKEILPYGMGQEEERCREALGRAASGQRVCLVSGGDPGIYGMAGPALECLRELALEKRPRVEVVPGVPALSAAASRLGAPLMNDFATISLSDILTPWEKIESRLKHAALGDFVIVLYNPGSRTRREQLGRAQKILLSLLPGETPAGLVRGATRAGELVRLTTLGELPKEEVDMATIIVIGNRSSFAFESYMVTPRGYSLGGAGGRTFGKKA